MNDVAGRFQLMPTAISTPGVDWITGSDKGPFIDTGHEVQFGKFGRLYLSVDTVREMAEAAGLFDEGASDGAITAHAAEYFRGYSDAVKENPNGHLADIVDRLGSVAAALGRTGGVALEGSPEVAVQMLRMQAMSRKADHSYSRQMALLLDKSLTLLSVKGPLEFQAVQAMNTGYDDSNSALTEQLPENEEVGPASGYEESFFNELSDAGIDPEFFRVSEPNEAPYLPGFDVQPRSVQSE